MRAGGHPDVVWVHVASPIICLNPPRIYGWQDSLSSAQYRHAALTRTGPTLRNMSSSSGEGVCHLTTALQNQKKSCI